MFNNRVKIFVGLIVLLAAVGVLRLVHMQLAPDSSIHEQINRLKLEAGGRRQIRTARGRILDRNGIVLAVSRPKFELHVDYTLTSLLDDRVKRAMLLDRGDARPLLPTGDGAGAELKAAEQTVEQVIDKCSHFAAAARSIRHKITEINNRMWLLRTFIAWARNGPDPALVARYSGNVEDVPVAEAIADFQRKFGPDKCLLLTAAVTDIPEMKQSWPLLELDGADDVFAAQVEFLDTEGVRIIPRTQRLYPWDAAAAQTIGWVGPPRPSDKNRFADDRLNRYLGDELCGRPDGAEYICETLLRGRRGEMVYDIDGRVVKQSRTLQGTDINLSLDIELQRRIQLYLEDCELNGNCAAATAVVVLDVPTGDILAMVSLPSYDLNTVRTDYAGLASDPNRPLLNRAVNQHYPPGSVIKPVILVAGLEAGEITPQEPINCRAQEAPDGWPNCWIYNQYGIGHDDTLSGGRQNYSRNALKGSCNIYFSRLADRLQGRTLQRWLFKFGYGRRTAMEYPQPNPAADTNRALRQTQGCISSILPQDSIESFDQIPPLRANEKRYFGIGQGNLRVTPLQVANAMATLARGGFFMPPRLFLSVGSAPPSDLRRRAEDIGISEQTLAVIRDGMSAVVNEPGGTAYSQFSRSGLARMHVDVFGKTGSTEAPENAWFAGFATDRSGRGISISLVVEGGRRGSSDAAPLARDIIGFCVEAGYLGGD